MAEVEPLSLSVAMESVEASQENGKGRAMASMKFFFGGRMHGDCGGMYLNVDVIVCQHGNNSWQG